MSKISELKASSSCVKQNESTLENNTKSQPSLGDEAKEGGRRRKRRQTQAQKFQPQDSHVCIIDGSQKEKWLQSEPLKQAAPNRCPPSLDKDFPDLSVALRLLSKCIVRDEFEESPVDERESKNSRIKKQKKLYQPRWKAPISVNITDIIKVTYVLANYS